MIYQHNLENDSDPPYLAQIPYATPNGVRSVLQFLAARQPKAATAAPEEFYDMSILKRIEESGFVKALYSRR